MRAILFATLLLLGFVPLYADLPRLRVSDNGRYLMKADGRPFFYLGDTAWELFHRLTREEADVYFADRAHKGFTVIQAVALAEEDGLNTPNSYGHRPFIENDPTSPAIEDGPANDYWDHVDTLIDKANALGLYVGLLPTWGDKWNRTHGAGPEIFTPENAGKYGEWLGRQYKDRALIWILGGDRNPDTERHRQIIAAMAQGLRRGDGGAHLISFHPRGGRSSGDYFHDEAWLDFNMRQNGHGNDFAGRYADLRQDYERQPVKPVLDAEPLYEDHPIAFRPTEEGYSVASDVRRCLYWDLFSGACGHTYGHHSVWQMWSARVPKKNNPLMPWTEAIAQPGSAQMQHARWLLESRPYFTRIPDDSIIVSSDIKTAVPGAGRYRFVGTRESSGAYAMVYAPVGRKFSVRLDVLSGQKARAWWYDPRTGAATPAGEYPTQGTQEFRSPDPGEDRDWVLVLDDAAKQFGPPGVH